MKVTLSLAQMQYLVTLFAVIEDPEDMISILPAERATVNALARRGLLWILPDPLTDEAAAVVQLTPYGYALHEDQHLPALQDPRDGAILAWDFTQHTFDIDETDGVV